MTLSATSVSCGIRPTIHKGTNKGEVNANRDRHAKSE